MNHLISQSFHRRTAFGHMTQIIAPSAERKRLAKEQEGYSAEGKCRLFGKIGAFECDISLTLGRAAHRLPRLIWNRIQVSHLGSENSVCNRCVILKVSSFYAAQLNLSTTRDFGVNGFLTVTLISAHINVPNL